MEGEEWLEISKEDLDSMASTTCACCTYCHTQCSSICNSTRPTVGGCQSANASHQNCYCRNYNTFRLRAQLHAIIIMSGSNANDKWTWNIRYERVFHRVPSTGDSGVQLQRHGGQHTHQAIHRWRWIIRYKQFSCRMHCHFDGQVHDPLLQGIRCYADASTLPDHPSIPSRKAGIGVFIINNQMQPPQTIYIKALMTGSNSVLMAQAAALALATTVIDRLNFNIVNFLFHSSR